MRLFLSQLPPLPFDLGTGSETSSQSQRSGSMKYLRREENYTPLLLHVFGFKEIPLVVCEGKIQLELRIRMFK